MATYLEGRRAMLVVRFGVLGFFIAAAFTAVAVSFHPRFMLAFSLPLIVLAGVVIAESPPARCGVAWPVAPPSSRR